ncbi:MAG: AI-2E family transporter [Bacilli bacterium]|jgi:predicted PurR-regulated permease PerM|nr:AI-2E family transporter [Bacilli bacterium]
MSTTVKMIKILLFLLILILCILIFPTIKPYFNIIVNIIVNIFVAFGLAYVSYPVIKFLKSKKIPSKIASLITIILLFGLIAVIVYLMVRLVYPQVMHVTDLVSTTKGGIQWIQENPNLNKVIDYIMPYLDKIGQASLDYLSNITQTIINKSTSFIISAVFVIIMYLYIIFDHENIISNLKTRLVIGTKRYAFFKKLNQALLKYLKALAIICAITCVEYGLIYKIAGHPDWLSLAALCAFSNLIPYFGGIIVNLIALFTAIFVSKTLFFIILALVIIMPNIDGNIINPLVYKNTVKISPIVVLPAMIVFSGLFGFLGIVLVIPAIIFIRIFKEFYGQNIKNYIIKTWNG